MCQKISVQNTRDASAGHPCRKMHLGHCKRQIMTTVGDKPLTEMSIHVHLLIETKRREKERLLSRKPSDEYRRNDGIRSTSFDNDRSNN